MNGTALEKITNIQTHKMESTVDWAVDQAVAPMPLLPAHRDTREGTVLVLSNPFRNAYLETTLSQIFSLAITSLTNFNMK